MTAANSSSSSAAALTRNPTQLAADLDEMPRRAVLWLIGVLAVFIVIALPGHRWPRSTWR